MFAHVQFRPATASEREARRRALLAEAKAWRRYAIIADAIPRDADTWTRREIASVPFRGTAVWDGMLARNRYHDGDLPLLAKTAEESIRCAVLRALFLALECEDEAAALKSPRRSAQQGRTK